MEEVHLSYQMQPVTGLATREISRNTEGQRELDMLGTHPRNPQMIFHNE